MATTRLINQNELMPEIDKVYYDHYAMAYDQTIHDFYNAVRRRIRRCTSVDSVKVVHGRWIYEAVEFTYEKDIKCSVCGCYVEQASNYCPNCGAKMDGVQE